MVDLGLSPFSCLELPSGLSQSNRCISFTCRPRDETGSRRENEERAKETRGDMRSEGDASGSSSRWFLGSYVTPVVHSPRPPGYAGPEDEGGRGEVERRKE